MMPSNQPALLGIGVGAAVGEAVGVAVGGIDGDTVGDEDGDVVGADVGIVGDCEGEEEDHRLFIPRVHFLMNGHSSQSVSLPGRQRCTRVLQPQLSPNLEHVHGSRAELHGPRVATRSSVCCSNRRPMEPRLTTAKEPSPLVG